MVLWVDITLLRARRCFGCAPAMALLLEKEQNLRGGTRQIPRLPRLAWLASCPNRAVGPGCQGGVLGGAIQAFGWLAGWLAGSLESIATVFGSVYLGYMGAAPALPRRPDALTPGR